MANEPGPDRQDQNRAEQIGSPGRKRWESDIRILTAILCSITICFGLSSPAHAQSLTEVLTHAYESNPRILAARQALLVVNEQFPQAVANWLPTVSTAMSADRALSSSRTATDSNSRTDTYKNTLSYSQTLFDGGRNFARLDRSIASVRSQQQTLRLTEQGVLLDVVRAYMNVIRDRRTLAAREANRTLLEQQFDSTLVQFDLQQRTIADLSQAQARLSAAEATVIAAVNSLATSEEQYLELTGLEPGTLVAPAVPGDLPVDLEETVVMAETFQPAVDIAKYAVELAEHDAAIENRSRLPTVALGASLTHQRSKEAGGDVSTDQRDVSASVTLTIPLYQSGAELSRVRAARTLVGQRRTELDDARRTARSNAVTAWRTHVSATGQIDSLAEAARAAETARDGIARELGVGRRSVIDLLDAEAELLTAQVNLAVGERNALVAAFEVLNAMGLLTAEELELPTRIYDPAVDFDRTKWKLYSTED